MVKQDKYQEIKTHQGEVKKPNPNDIGEGKDRAMLRPGWPSSRLGFLISLILTFLILILLLSFNFFTAGPSHHLPSQVYSARSVPFVFSSGVCQFPSGFNFSGAGWLVGWYGKGCQ